MLSLLQWPEALCVHDHVLFGGVIFTLNELRPDPQTFGACIDGRANLEADILVEKYSVENVTLTGPVFPNDSDDTDMFLLVDILAEPFDGLLVDG